MRLKSLGVGSVGSCLLRQAEALAELRTSSRRELEELVQRYSRSDGTVDHLGLAVLLGANEHRFQRTDVDELVQLLFERFGVKPGGSVPSTRVVQWLVGSTPQSAQLAQSSLRDVDLNLSSASGSQLQQQLLVKLAARLPAQEFSQVPEPQPQQETVRTASPVTPLGPPLQSVGTGDPASALFDIAHIARTGEANNDGPRDGPLAQPVQPVQATLQLARPLRGGLERQLSEVLATSLGLEAARLRILGADDGASRICLQVRPAKSAGSRGVSSQDVIAELVRQLGDPASPLAAVPSAENDCSRVCPLAPCVDHV